MGSVVLLILTPSLAGDSHPCCRIHQFSMVAYEDPPFPPLNTSTEHWLTSRSRCFRSVPSRFEWLSSSNTRQQGATVSRKTHPSQSHGDLKRCLLQSFTSHRAARGEHMRSLEPLIVPKHARDLDWLQQNRPRRASFALPPLGGSRPGAISR